MATYTTEKIENRIESDIITAMIISDDFLRKILTLSQEPSFVQFFSREIFNWCKEYYNKYKEAPKKNIRSLFEAKRKDLTSHDQEELIETFIENIGDRYNPRNFNTDLVYERTINYFREQALNKHIDKVRGFVSINDLEAAEAEIRNFCRPQDREVQDVNIFQDIEGAISCINKQDTQEEVVFSFPGELGKLIRPLKKKDFFCIVSPAKRGKTWFLVYIAVMAAMAGRKVVFFSFEMPEEELRLRIYQFLSGQPLKEVPDEEEGKEILFPYFDNNYERTNIIGKKKLYKKFLSPDTVKKKLEGAEIFASGGQLRLVCRPSNSWGVEDIGMWLDNVDYFEGWVPQVILVDYADIMKAGRKKEARHEINDVWLGLRGLAQDRDALVVTPSHSSKATFGRDIKQDDLSEDNRKLNHVSAGIAVNQNEEDAERSSCRISVIADRHRMFNLHVEYLVLQQLIIGQPYLDARYYKENIE